MTLTKARYALATRTLWGLLQEKQDDALGFLLHGRPEQVAYQELCENSQVFFFFLTSR